ncbi:family 20 glycosylhydrolase [Membranicola marinus]|uniref:Family 20 glycosylhydrolase n=1 Tax=Membranihabitans marinus TaxID=1227546 RepID=A0A953I0S8_9BACT|nr:family 20 glycosylhydrolase [Membranihabitans marinus]MBY5959177.1 family 20 glycosylhydrolase [Membranihabitans marinus]
MYNRRKFIKDIAVASSIATSPFPASFIKNRFTSSQDKIWACLLHLSFNMWEEYISPHRPFRGYRPNLQFSEALWNKALHEMADQGLNMVVIDLGDGVKYESYPDIAVNNAWSVDKLKSELTKARKLGLEPIPKLNFSAGHDTWMGVYGRMVSTEPYYEFCSNIIKEVSDIFDQPRLFHLGLDEETFSHQSRQKHIVIRQRDAWWKDFYFLVEEVEKNNSRAWIWPDYFLWNEPEMFFKRMPKSVVQSNWYYGDDFSLKGRAPEGTPKVYYNKENKNKIYDSYSLAYLDIDAHGYDQIPTGSFHTNNATNIGRTVEFSKEHISDDKLLGFLQTIWKPTIEDSDRHSDMRYEDRIIKGIDLIGEAKKKYY